MARGWQGVFYRTNPLNTDTNSCLFHDDYREESLGWSGDMTDQSRSDQTPQDAVSNFPPKIQTPFSPKRRVHPRATSFDSLLPKITPKGVNGDNVGLFPEFFSARWLHVFLLGWVEVIKRGTDFGFFFSGASRASDALWLSKRNDMRHLREYIYGRAGKLLPLGKGFFVL